LHVNIFTSVKNINKPKTKQLLRIAWQTWFSDKQLDMFL